MSLEHGLLQVLREIFGTPSGSKINADLSCRRLQGVRSFATADSERIGMPCPQDDCRTRNIRADELFEDLNASWNIQPSQQMDSDIIFAKLASYNSLSPAPPQLRLDAFACILECRKDICATAERVFCSRACPDGTVARLSKEAHEGALLLEELCRLDDTCIDFPIRLTRLAHYGA